jgi:hypothetical protein
MCSKANDSNVVKPRCIIEYSDRKKVLKSADMNSGTSRLAKYLPEELPLFVPYI